MSESGGPPPAILLIDHDEHASRLLTTHLEKAGFRQTWVKTARQALRQVGEIAPHFVILELDAPGVDGFEMLARLLASPPCQGVPIMILAAKANIDDVQRALQLGASDYMTKPVDPVAIIERINRRLRRTPQFDSRG